jgi:hypothetical protein
MDLDKMPLDIAEIPEVEDNPYHPMNDRYYADMRHAENRVMAAQRQMKPKHVQIVKMHFAGWTNVKIAEQVGNTDVTVSRVIHTPAGQKLLQLLRYIQSAADGPSAAHRKAILYRIITDNEAKQPKVAITAIAEINKMDMNDHLVKSGTAPGQVTIIINENTFPRTALDN